MTDFGPSGQTVYERTYSRTKPDGTKEQWDDTVSRVINGNLNLVYKDESDWEAKKVDQEFFDLRDLMMNFSILPAGRHLWASGVQGRQYLFNCWVSGWGETVSSHFRFSFLRLMEGGGVGANYSSKNTEKYGAPKQAIEVHVVCDPQHPDFAEICDSGYLSPKYSAEYQGNYMEIEDSREGWADALSDLLEAAWDENASQVRVYDISRVRCAGSRLKTFGGSASGPGPLAKMLKDIAEVLHELSPMPDRFDALVYGMTMDPISAMEIDHAIAQCVVAGGNRRSARMSMIPWDDPWAHDFIECKTESHSHWTTNISVIVNAEFFNCIEDEKHGGPDKARLVLEAVSEGMLTNGEPGFFNVTKANEGEVGYVECTNPCGEIPLEEWEACNLGHINLEAFVNEAGVFEIWDAKKAIRLMVRFLIRATFGDINDPESRRIMDRNRRIGVGLFGVQSALAKMGFRFSDTPREQYIWNLLRTLKEVARDEARSYAFELRIPEPVKVTTVAPTGTIAKLPGTTEGIHPIYSRYFIRRIRFSTIDPDQIKQLQDYEDQGYDVEPDLYSENTAVVSIPTKEKLVEEVEAMGYSADIVESADEIDMECMLAFQQMIQSAWADNAVSFTANVPVGDITPQELQVQLLNWLPHLKGTTIMVDDSRPQAPYERITREEYEALTGPKEIMDSIDEECANGVCPVR